jgi:hypothetical protein
MKHIVDLVSRVERLPRPGETLIGGDRGNAAEHIGDSPNRNPGLPGDFFDGGYVMPPFARSNSSVYAEPGPQQLSILALVSLAKVSRDVLAIVLDFHRKGWRVYSPEMNRFMKHIVVIGSLNTDLVSRVERLPRPDETLIGGDRGNAAEHIGEVYAEPGPANNCPPSLSLVSPKSRATFSR